MSLAPYIKITPDENVQTIEAVYKAGMIDRATRDAKLGQIVQEQYSKGMSYGDMKVKLYQIKNERV